MAEKLAAVVDGDLFEITPDTPYTDADLNWMDANSRSTIEMKDLSSRPTISGNVENMKDYDTVYVGFPIWWYIAPTIINTFLESYDFSGKTVIPFCTSGGSEVGKTDDSLHPSCSAETNWKPAKKFGSTVASADLRGWVDSLDV